MTKTLHTIELTNLEISTILYYIEGGMQGVNESEIEPEVYSIFKKLENIKWLTNNTRLFHQLIYWTSG